MRGVRIDKSYGDLRAFCPFCSHNNVIKHGNRGDVCVHLVDEAQMTGKDMNGHYFFFKEV